MKKVLLALTFILAAHTLQAQVLYGTTIYGGKNNSGTICKLVTTNNTLTAAFSFDGLDGIYPEYLKLLQASDGKLYGTTGYRGSGGYGTIFSYNPATSIYTKLKDFDGTNEGNPAGSLMQASDGKLYGMTYEGGTNGYGIIFSFDPATLTYTKLEEFDYTNGGHPWGDLLQALMENYTE